MNKMVCENCVYFRSDEEDINMGECRRYAPKPFRVTEDPINPTVWPNVACLEWCGEGKLKRV